jgi:hypothetical protein
LKITGKLTWRNSTGRYANLLKWLTQLMLTNLDGYFQIKLVEKAYQTFLAKAVKLGAHEGRYFRLLDAQTPGRFDFGVAVSL